MAVACDSSSMLFKVTHVDQSASPLNMKLKRLRFPKEIWSHFLPFIVAQSLPGLSCRRF